MDIQIFIRRNFEYFFNNLNQHEQGYQLSDRSNSNPQFMADSL